LQPIEACESIEACHRGRRHLPQAVESDILFSHVCRSHGGHRVPCPAARASCPRLPHASRPDAARTPQGLAGAAPAGVRRPRDGTRPARTLMATAGRHAARWHAAGRHAQPPRVRALVCCVPLDPLHPTPAPSMPPTLDTARARVGACVLPPPHGAPLDLGVGAGLGRHLPECTGSYKACFDTCRVHGRQPAVHHDAHGPSAQLLQQCTMMQSIHVKPLHSNSRTRPASTPAASRRSESRHSANCFNW
jgi:hypothetical protein